jgi:cation transport regulator
MPYRTNHDLPAPIRRRLPPHAKTFTVRLSITLLQHTLAMHATRRQRIAWAAEKRSYVKLDDTWIAR